jgi:hypothetical protein
MEYNKDRTRTIVLYQELKKATLRLATGIPAEPNIHLALLFLFMEYREPPCADYWIHVDSNNSWFLSQVRTVCSTLKPGSLLEYMYRWFEVVTFSNEVRFGTQGRKSYWYVDDEYEAMIRVYYGKN